MDTRIAHSNKKKSTMMLKLIVIIIDSQSHILSQLPTGPQQTIFPQSICLAIKWTVCAYSSSEFESCTNSQQHKFIDRISIDFVVFFFHCNQFSFDLHLFLNR